MNWIYKLLNKFTGADVEIARLKLRATMAETDAEELKRTCDDLYSRISEVGAWAANQVEVLNMWHQMALKIEKAHDSLKAEMEANGLTKAQLDEQAAIQLEMDGHRVDLERELKEVNASRDHYKDEYLDAVEGFDKLSSRLDEANIKLRAFHTELQEHKQYKTLYFSALEDIKKARIEKKQLIAMLPEGARP